ncbi:MAG: LysR family transcriptional regulator [Burkholderiales bacterium]|nr:LysR family transcriptional regulator [Burkholderiales bacterium]
MELSQLRAFVMVTKEGNLTRAALQLHLTQPAVSLQIKALQQSLKVQLFTRTSTGMALTSDGAKLLPLAERIISGSVELIHAAHTLHSTIAGDLAIGTILDPEFTRLGAFLKLLVEAHPQISTRLQQGMSGWVEQEIRNGNLDVGYFVGTPARDCHSIVLTSFIYNVVAPPGWRRRVENKDWKSLAALPWVWSPPASVHNRLLTKVFDQYQVNPGKVAMVDQEASMLDLVKSGIGLSLVRESSALREARAHGLVIANAVSVATELSFLCLNNRRREPTIDRTFQLMQDLWQQ